MTFKKISLSLMTLIACISLAGCADNLNSPCGNFGKWCSKAPINQPAASEQGA